MLAANPSLNIVIGNVPDLRSTPALKAVLAQTPALAQFAAGVDQGIQAYNAQVAGIAAGNARVAVADLYGTSQAPASGQPVQVGDLLLDTNVPGNGYDHYFVDAIHPGTAAQGLLANLFVQASNDKFAVGITPLSGQEISTFARSLPVPLPSALPSGLILLGAAGLAFKVRRRVA